MKRIYHPVSKWEEIAHNMWGECEDRHDALMAAIELTGDHDEYGRYMLRVVREWPVSCENALTDPFLNRKAWVGHAAVALALRIPEDVTREAWGYLTDEQRVLANAQAARAIREFENNHATHIGLHPNVGTALLF